MKTMRIETGRLLSIEEVCERCGVSRATVLAWRKSGVGGVRLRSLRIGNRIKVRETELVAFLGTLPDEVGVCNANEQRKETA
ncbi:MAG: hypothetical protein Phyf2KO_00600 [Phycisphaerales bacterium]